MQYTKLVLVLAFLFQFFGAKSQNFNYKLKNISVNYHRGFISDQNKRNKNVFDYYINGLEIVLSKIPDGSRAWHHVFNYPETGFSLSYFDLGNQNYLGRFFSVSRFVDFNLYETERFDLDFRSSLGISIVTKYFHPSENYKNTFFSKPLNFFFAFNMSSDYKIFKEKDLYLTSGLTLMHASNGTTKLPNNGISSFNLFLGFSKKDLTKPEFNAENREIKSKKIKIDILPTIGLKEHWLWGGDKYLALSLSTDILYTLNKKQLLGLGIGVFYDETLKQYSNHNVEPVEMDVEATAGSIQLTHHLNLYPFFIVFKKGFLLVNSENFPYKGYNLLGLRYFIIPKMYISMYHKSHKLFIGDNMQWGLGFEL